MYIDNDEKAVQLNDRETSMILDAWSVYYTTYLSEDRLHRIRTVYSIRENLRRYSVTDAIFTYDGLSIVFDSLFNSDSVKLRDKRFTVYLDQQTLDEYDIESVLDLVYL